MKKVTLDDKFRLFDQVWTPKIVAAANGQLVKLAKGEGTLVWHTHEHEDELFLVVFGKLTIAMETHTVDLLPGELFVVPRGTAHCPTATPGTRFLMIEPETCSHTGAEKTVLTVNIEDQEWI
ncbi:cupin domain-containing protein [Myxococcota bacterium]|nr:cupin domain-containing protein [Myxococcota bacterium]MBU1536667.1 cupin domain-containing protein [Myxococcota bacterium]